MPRKKWINRNDPSTQTFTLLYRSQDDPLLHDSSAGERALFPTTGKTQQAQTVAASSSSSAHTSSAADYEEYQRQKGLHLADLEDTGSIDLNSMRDNEGEAAQYGVYFDDSDYDYMQHLRDVGEGGGDSHFVDAIPVTVKGKGKGKPMRLEDALREVSIRDEEEEPPQLVDSRTLGEGFSTFSKSGRQRTYQDQQDVPDDIAGFQPDMDPRLREVLEALDDDAYVDDEDEEDVFGALAKAGKNEGELDLYEFEDNYVDEEDEGWESDVTEKATAQPRELKIPSEYTTSRDHTFDGDAQIEALHNDLSEEAAAAAAAEDGDWLRDFAKFKRDSAATTTRKPAPKADGSIAAASGVQDRAPTLYTLNGTPLRQKKRKGAQTNPSAYSMTSSSLARTEGLQLLDARFDQVEKMYALDEADEYDDGDGGMSLVSGMTGMTGKSKMSVLSTTSFADEGAVRGDFDNMMDDFLGDWNKANPGGKRKGAKGKRGKNGNEVHGLAQLEEVRAELGRGRLAQKAQRA